MSIEDVLRSRNIDLLQVDERVGVNFDFTHINQMLEEVIRSNSDLISKPVMFIHRGTSSASVRTLDYNNKYWIIWDDFFFNHY